MKIKLFFIEWALIYDNIAIRKALNDVLKSFKNAVNPEKSRQLEVGRFLPELDRSLYFASINEKSWELLSQIDPLT